MKSSRAQAAVNREHVLEVGSQRYRELGFDGIGVVDLMKDAGQTHGAFYGQFSSKEQFMGEASAHGFRQMLENWKAAGELRAADGSMQTLAGLVEAYLTPAHRDNPGQGCVAAALGAEAARRGPAVRSAMTQGIEALFDMTSSFSQGSDQGARRREAITMFSSLVGALVLARAVDDPALADEMMSVVRTDLLGRLPGAESPN